MSNLFEDMYEMLDLEVIEVTDRLSNNLYDIKVGGVLFQRNVSYKIVNETIVKRLAVLIDTNKIVRIKD